MQLVPLLPSIIAVVSALVAIVAAGTAIYQAILARRSNTATLILKLDDRFNENLVNSRIQAAESLQNRTWNENKDALEDVLDFFETLGIMVRRRILHEEFVWHTFFYWIHEYYTYSKDFIENQQKLARCRYVDLTYLHAKTLRLEERKCGQINQSEWGQFLREEQELVSPAISNNKAPSL